MKKIILVIAFIALTVSINAQSKMLTKRANISTEFVAARMELSDANKAYLYKTIFANYDATKKANLKEVQGNEEKKAIKKKLSESLNSELLAKFSEKETKEILDLLKKEKIQKREKNKKDSN